MIINGPSFAVSNNIDNLIILLHGRGATGDNIISIAPVMSKILPKSQFIAPNAHINYNMGYAWFSSSYLQEDIIFNEMKKSAEIVNNFIDEQLKKLKLSDNKLSLIGFSQGAMLAMHVALCRKLCASVVSYSGAILCPNLLKHEIIARPNMCIIHGNEDYVVPFIHFNNCMAFLTNNNVPAKYHEIKGLDHSISTECIIVGAEFIKSCISHL
ncbi:alpha/beta hydrolase [Candidatus Neoehrlichia procyonis]|uniref:Phospholipase/Carboxylesterase family protein n=1 Tax=Candidatus Neoehrlichia procyonis str. RAC413 TaxID=1359163 RepID=A0A0F3NPB7_9RICK|nr:dienelactone hydrolase family protein [Candidatus Neoehrlichia lotoris]KJV69581.1 phospholipase/Carboxylesterase family protein [Candidatus Neoehrlichia lotoris str. RAC413]